MRLVRVRVLPVPAPATIKRGLSTGASTADFCCKLRPKSPLGVSWGLNFRAIRDNLVSISRILVQLNAGAHKPWIVAIFLGIGLVATGTMVSVRASSQAAGILGGPAEAPGIESKEANSAVGLMAGQAIIPDDPYIIGSESQGASLDASFLDGSVASQGSLPGTHSRDQENGSTSLTTKAAPDETASVPESEDPKNLPLIKNYFIKPTVGLNWGILHPHNAVDIANACGTPIYASAEGLVTDVKSFGWNEGYGSYIIIEHPNNTKTRYAHNQKNVASIGDYVLQGDVIAYIGNTGLTHGPTGCHVHFEVVGARNPFAK